MPALLHIDLESPDPVYRQIIGSLRALLTDGTLKPGDKLPPVRQLAMDLGVHHNTVAQAYRALADEGWLDLRRRRGVRVLERKTPRPDPKARVRFARRVRELAAEAGAAGVDGEQIAEELRGLATELGART